MAPSPQKREAWVEVVNEDLLSLSPSSCMSGYINNTLSTAWANDQNIQDFLPHQMVTSDGLNVTHCRSDHPHTLLNKLKQM